MPASLSKRLLKISTLLLILMPFYALKGATPHELSPISSEQKLFWNPLFMKFNERTVAPTYEIAMDKIFVGTSADLLTLEPILHIKGEGATILGSFRLMEKFDNGDHFMIDLEKYGISLIEGKLYELEMTGSFRKKLYAYVRKVRPNTEEEPLTNISYNSISVLCEDNSGSVIDYYGRIDNGAPPFNYIWIVYRGSRENYLYQPVVGKITNMAEVPGITVEQPLGYTVVFAVRDACGNYVEKYLNIRCGDDENYGNTIFLQTTPNTVTDPNLNNSN